MASCALEGIRHASIRAALYGHLDREKLPVMCSALSFAAAEKSLRVQAASELFSRQPGENGGAVVREILHSAVRIECQFLRHCLPVELMANDADVVEGHVKCVANRLVVLALVYSDYV